MDRAYSPEIEGLAAELNTAFVQQRAPLFERGSVSAWAEAINLQMIVGQVDVAEHGLRHLHNRFPTVTFTNRVGEIFDKLPLAGTAIPFKDDRASDFQVLQRDGAETTLLMFCGAVDDLGLPLSVMHRWLGRLNANLIYLRDFHRRHYLRGVASLGSSREATVAELKRIVARLGAKRTACYGASAGVFGALQYGLELGASAVLCAGGTANLYPNFNAYLAYARSARTVFSDFPEAELDMHRFYAAAVRTPDVRMVFGTDHWDDRIHAEHMSKLPSVILQPLENFAEHNVVVELIRRGQLEGALRWLVPDSVGTAVG